jgi:hypothetical protein
MHIEISVANRDADVPIFAVEAKETRAQTM